MWKNSHIHLVLETDFLENVKKQAKEEGISISELCRKRLKETPQLTRIECMLIRLEKALKIAKYREERG